MTQNQLKFWELRWKQHYEHVYLQLDAYAKETERLKQQETVRHNIRTENLEARKLRESERHNRVTEKQESQRIIQENIKLQHDAERIAQEWAKISQNERANIVKFTIDAYNAETNRTKVQNEFIEAMAKVETAQQELALEAIKARDQKDLRMLEQAVKLGEKSFNLELKLPEIVGGSKLKVTGAPLTTLAFGVSAWIKEYLPNEYDTYVGRLSKITNTTFENYGPQAQDKLTDTVQKVYNNASIPKLEGTVQGHSGSQNQRETDHRESEFANISGIVNTNSSKVGSIKGVVEHVSPSGTKVIYSGGSHYGPGYEL